MKEQTHFVTPGTEEKMEEKTLEYYMELPYTVELRLDEAGGYAQIRELPGCQVSIDGSDNVERLGRLLEEAKRKGVERALRGRRYLAVSLEQDV